MIVRNSNIKPFDVDATLVLHLDPNYQRYDNFEFVCIPDAVTSKDIRVALHKPMIRLLAEELYRGATILVWSRGGHQWAADVLRVLGYDPEKDSRFIVMDKPLVYFDDLDVAKWMTERIYLEPDTVYKRLK